MAAGFGGIPDIIGFLSAAPYHLKAQWDFIKHNMEAKTFSPALMATVQMTVARETDCV